jgi:O-antigen/teichoic acid export membrane protein
MFWRGVLGYLPANVVQGLIGFLSLYVFTRLLSGESYGRYAVAYAVVSLVHTALLTWIEAAMARFQVAEADTGREADHAATLYRLFGWMSLGLVVAAGASLLFWRTAPELTIAVFIGLVSAAGKCALRLVQERARAEGQVGLFVSLDMTFTLVGFGAGAALALAGLGGGAPLAGAGLAALLCVAWTWRGEQRRRTGGRFDPERARRYAAYGLPVSLSLILSIGLFSADRLIIAGLLGHAAAGAYHAGYSVANRTLDVLFIWLGAASSPALVAAFERGGRDALREAAPPHADLMVLIGLPAAVGLMLVARPLAEVMVGPELRGAAARVTPWIALAALCSGFTTYYLHQAFTLARRTGLLLGAMVLPLVANIGLNLLLIPRFGLDGAAWATAASFALGAVASWALGSRAEPLPVPAAALLRSGLACAAMAAAVIALPSSGGVGELLLKAATGAAVYGLAALALDAGGARGMLAAALARIGYSRKDRSKIAIIGSTR